MDCWISERVRDGWREIRELKAHIGSLSRQLLTASCCCCCFITTKPNPARAQVQPSHQGRHVFALPIVHSTGQIPADLWQWWWWWSNKRNVFARICISFGFLTDRLPMATSEYAAAPRDHFFLSSRLSTRWRRILHLGLGLGLSIASFEFSVFCKECPSSSLAPKFAILIIVCFNLYHFRQIWPSLRKEKLSMRRE